MKLVRVTGQWSLETNDVEADGDGETVEERRDVILNADAIVRVYPTETGAMALALADGFRLIVSPAEFRRILRAAGATMPPRPSRKPPVKPKGVHR